MILFRILHFLRIVLVVYPFNKNLMRGLSHSCIYSTNTHDISCRYRLCAGCSGDTDTNMFPALQKQMSNR